MTKRGAREREDARSLLSSAAKLTLVEEELDEVRAILPGGAGDESHLPLAVTVHGVHLAALVLVRLPEHLDTSGNRDGHFFFFFYSRVEEKGPIGLVTRRSRERAGDADEVVDTSVF